MIEILEKIGVKVRLVSKIVNLSLLMLVILTPRANSQYLLLGDQNDYEVKHYKLNTKELYGTDFNIETFNVIFSKEHNRHERLLLITALPDIVTGELWEEIDEDEVVGNTINPSEFLSGESSILGFRQDVGKLKTLNKPQLVKKDFGRWWVALNTLTEPFEIIEKASIFFKFIWTFGTRAAYCNHQRVCTELPARRI